jgi:hypothetical protein
MRSEYISENSGNPCKRRTLVVDVEGDGPAVLHWKVRLLAVKLVQWIPLLHPPIGRAVTTDSRNTHGNTTKRWEVGMLLVSMEHY